MLLNCAFILFRAVFMWPGNQFIGDLVWNTVRNPFAAALAIATGKSSVPKHWTIRIKVNSRIIPSYHLSVINNAAEITFEWKLSYLNGKVQ
jgi:hypothetical protein